MWKARLAKRDWCNRTSKSPSRLGPQNLPFSSFGALPHFPPAPPLSLFILSHLTSLVALQLSQPPGPPSSTSFSVVVSRYRIGSTGFPHLPFSLSCSFPLSTTFLHSNLTSDPKSTSSLAHICLVKFYRSFARCVLVLASDVPRARLSPQLCPSISLSCVFLSAES